MSIKITIYELHLSTFAKNIVINKNWINTISISRTSNFEHIMHA